jgi:hypothetical protein
VSNINGSLNLNERKVISVFAGNYIDQLYRSIRSVEFGVNNFGLKFDTELDKYLVVSLASLVLGVRNDVGENELFVSELYVLCNQAVSEATENFALLDYPPGFTPEWDIVKLSLLIVQPPLLIADRTCIKGASYYFNVV